MSLVLDPLVFLGSVFSAVFLLQLWQFMRNRQAFRGLADALGATHVPMGTFGFGRIEGVQGDRKYVILTDGVVSCVATPAENTGLPLCVGLRFFVNFPDWRFVYSISYGAEQDPVASRRQRDLAVPLDEKYRPQAERLLRELRDALSVEDDSQLSRGSLWLHRRRMDFQCPGMLRDPVKVERMLRHMSTVAVRLRFLPVE